MRVKLTPESFEARNYCASVAAGILEGSESRGMRTFHRYLVHRLEVAV